MNCRRQYPTSRPAVRRRGVACVLAMLFLVLFTTMSLGFYASTTMSAQVAANEDRVFTARVSAESGMEFMKYQLSRVSIPPTHTDPAVVVQDVAEDLTTSLQWSRDAGTATVGLTDLVISFPAAADQSIPLNGVAGGASTARGSRQ